MKLIDKLRMWSILRLKLDGIYVPSIEYDFWNKNLELMKLRYEEFENELPFDVDGMYENNQRMADEIVNQFEEY